MTLKKSPKSVRLRRLVDHVSQTLIIRAFMEALYVSVMHLEILSSKNSLTTSSFPSHPSLVSIHVHSAFVITLLTGSSLVLLHWRSFLNSYYVT
jgi:hypothetical protein